MKISEAGKRKQSSLLANGASVIFYKDTILINYISTHKAGEMAQWFTAHYSCKRPRFNSQHPRGS